LDANARRFCCASAIDRGGLAGIAAADEGHLGQTGWRQLRQQAARRGEKSSGVGPRQRRLGGSALSGLAPACKACVMGIVKSMGFSRACPDRPCRGLDGAAQDTDPHTSPNPRLFHEVADPVRPRSPTIAALTRSCRSLPRRSPQPSLQTRPRPIPPRARRCPPPARPATRPTARVACREPDPAGPAPRIPGQAADRVQVGQAQQRHHEGHGRRAERGRHEEHRRVLRVSKQAKPGFAKNKDTVALGEKIYRGGIAEKQVPACAGCHSPNGAGIPAQYPRMGGQHADYTEAQLVAFRSGLRANSVQMTVHRRKHERQGNQGRLRLHRRPALSPRVGRRKAIPAGEGSARMLAASA
jgi:hypothetical protein